MNDRPVTAAHRQVILLAALVWFSGGVILLTKGGSLVVEGMRLRPDSPWPWFAVVAGLVVGGLKTRYIFTRLCRRNLERIAALAEPRPWQAYRNGFYVFLATMTALGAALTRVALDNYGVLIGLAVLDLGLGLALLASGRAFRPRPS